MILVLYGRLAPSLELSHHQFLIVFEKIFLAMQFIVAYLRENGSACQEKFFLTAKTFTGYHVMLPGCSSFCFGLCRRSRPILRSIACLRSLPDLLSNMRLNVMPIPRRPERTIQPCNRLPLPNPLLGITSSMDWPKRNRALVSIKAPLRLIFRMIPLCFWLS